MVNHFEFQKEISTKVGLVKNLTAYCVLFHFNNYFIKS